MPLTAWEAPGPVAHGEQYSLYAFNINVTVYVVSQRFCASPDTCLSQPGKPLDHLRTVSMLF
jgi:hypothetical protein